MSDKNPLIGKTVTKIELADDQQAIRFTLAEGDPIVARCDGDCCSVTWIEDILNPEALLNSPVLSVEDIELPKDLQGPTKQKEFDEEEMQYYGFSATTAMGKFLIAYRNSSNGYYGGSLAWPNNDYYYGGVHSQNVSTEVWKEVKA